MEDLVEYDHERYLAEKIEAEDIDAIISESYFNTHICPNCGGKLCSNNPEGESTYLYCSVCNFVHRR